MEFEGTHPLNLNGIKVSTHIFELKNLLGWLTWNNLFSAAAMFSLVPFKITGQLGTRSLIFVV